MNDRTVFNESKAFDHHEIDEAACLTRRIATYSIDALRAASQVEGIIVQIPGFERYLGLIDRLFQRGREFSVPHGMRLIGDRGSGRDTLLTYFQASLPKSGLYGDHSILKLRMPAQPHCGLFVRQILEQLNYPFTGGSYKLLYQRRKLSFDALKGAGTRLIWVSKAEHLVRTAKPRETQASEGETSDYIGEMMEECRVSVVLSGSKRLSKLPDCAPDLCKAISSVEEIKPLLLDANWVGFVKAFAQKIRAFDASFLFEPPQYKRLHAACDGNLLEFKQLMVEVTCLHHDQAAPLSLEMLRLAYERVFGNANFRANPFA